MSKIIIMDEQGHQYEVVEIEQMLNSFLDEDLEDIYKSTRYFNELNLAVEELVDCDLIKQMDGERYNKDAVKRGLKYFSDEIVKRLGKDKLKEFDSQVDEDWKANKPDLEKYKKGKKD